VSFLFKPVYLVYRLYSGGRYWLRRRFTLAGMGVLAGVVAAALLGPDTDNNVAYQAFALLLCLVLLSMLTAWSFRARFAATRLLPRFGTVGIPFTYTVRLENLTAKTQAGLTLLENLADPRPSFPDWLEVQRAEEKDFRSLRLGQRRQRPNFFRLAQLKEAALPTALPHQAVETRLEVTPLRRGLLRFSGLALARTDPLGLFRAFVKLPLPQSALILPRRYLVPPVALAGSLKYQPGGVALASNVGQSEEFVALRDYRQGDPLRRIHWRSWAHAGKPVVKEVEDEFFVRHALVLDTFSPHRHSAVFEEAVSVAASFACTVQTQESLLDLLFVGPESYCFTAGRGVAHADQMLEVLASVQTCPDKAFHTIEELVLNHVQLVSGCICVLLAWDEARQAFVRKLRALGVPLMVLVVVEAGARQKLEPGPLHDEPQRFHVLECGKIEEGLANLQ
jgi:uncharacterized protein (DUF58 family)